MSNEDKDEDRDQSLKRNLKWFRNISEEDCKQWYSKDVKQYIHQKLYWDHREQNEDKELSFNSRD